MPPKPSFTIELIGEHKEGLKEMKKALVVSAVITLLCLSGIAQAVVIDTVTVGNPGNAADTRYAGSNHGAVNYVYNIGKYEVTAAQYTDFLNHKAKSDPHGLYNVNMDTATPYSRGCNIKRSGIDGDYSYSVAVDWANRPVNHVSFWDSLRFINWLNNNQDDGDTETGAYTLNNYYGDDGSTIQRNPGAKWFLTSEDEWYKAVYYKGGTTDAGYWTYPTQSDSIPSNVLDNPTDPGNNATYYSWTWGLSGYTIDAPYYRTEVGAHENSESAYGTFDQGGNVWEWNEDLAYSTGSGRRLRGGSYWNSYEYLPAWCNNESYSPNMEYGDHIGFRVAGAVPEPSSLLALGGGLLGIFGLIRRRT